jgi:hypothetical protein
MRVHPLLWRVAFTFVAVLAITVIASGLAGAQQATPAATAAATPAAGPTPIAGAGGVQVIREPMPFTTMLAIAVVAAAASAVNGLVGAIFLFIIWMWLYGGVLPSIPIYLKEPAQYPWAPHLLLPLILFLLVWQYRLRGKIGPSWGLRHLYRQYMARRSGPSFA